MKDLIKQYWPVGIVAVILLVFGILLTGDVISSQFETKKVDGQDIVFEYNGINVSADELYDQLYDSYGFSAIIRYLELDVYRNAFEPDADLIAEAKLEAEQIKANLKATYGSEYEDYLIKAVVSLGYPASVDSLYEYALTSRMVSETQKNYVNGHINEYFPAYQEEKEPRMISHILIKMEVPDSPTEEELQKLEEVKAALAEPDANFAEIAAEYSDDTGSATSGGSLGFVDQDSISSYVENFKNHIYTVGAGETTEWFQTEYGYHIIRVDSESLEDFQTTDTFYSTLFTYYPTLRNKITWTLIQEQNISFGGNTELEQQIKEYYGVEE